MVTHSRATQRKGLSLERLASFLAVVEAGGIARAAPGDPVRQSQLSRQVGELEAALGAPLFDRSAQGPRVPTRAGAQLARVVRELHRGIDEVDAGPLPCNVGAGDSALRWLLLPHARELENVELHVGARSSEEVVQELVDGTLDLGVVRASTALPDGLQVARLGTVAYALFAPRARGRARPLEAPLAVATGEPTLAAQLAPHIQALGPIALRCETFPQVAVAVRAGYAGILPTIARRELEAARFVRGPVLASATLVLVWRARLDAVRPALVPVRRALAAVLKRALARS